MFLIRRYLLLCVPAMLALLLSGRVSAGSPYDEAPIHYSQTAPEDPIAALQKRLDAGEATLTYDEQHGYLPALLKLLEIPVESQTLVFSKTSFQRERISPQTPRALYFSDDVYIGSVVGGKVLEISAVDPKQGAMFYTLRQRRRGRPEFVRQTSECLQCHGSSMTRNIPGHIVRSVYSDREGFPLLRMGSHLIDHDSPFEERWGGWYVTGTHGDMRHLGNMTLADDEAASLRSIDMEPGANVTKLETLIDTRPYLTPHSDIVALMVLEHQTRAHNLITEANYATRRALQEEAVLNELSGDPKDKPLPFVERRLAHTGERLLKYMLFVDEPKLAAPVKGTSGFAAYFSARKPKDSKGRSLFQLDLQTRLFKHRLSYLVYSDAFNSLPPRMKDYLYRRLHEILTGTDRGEDYAALSDADCRVVLEILLETKPDFAAFVKRNK